MHFVHLNVLERVSVTIGGKGRKHSLGRGGLRHTFAWLHAEAVLGGVQLHSKTSGVEILPVLNLGSVRERPSGGEETRPLTATRYKYDITEGGGGLS